MKNLAPKREKRKYHIQKILLYFKTKTFFRFYFFCWKALDRITEEPVIGPDGKRLDKKLQKREIPVRITEMMHRYRDEALLKHRSHITQSLDEDSPLSNPARRKMPLQPGIRQNAKVAPAIAATVGFN